MGSRKLHFWRRWFSGSSIWQWQLRRFGYSYRAGYFCGQSGGGGIGGEGGDGQTNYYPGTYGPTGGASGGGSLGGGRNGQLQYTNQQGYPSYYAPIQGSDGGKGIASSVFDSTYTDHMISVGGYSATTEH